MLQQKFAAVLAALPVIGVFSVATALETEDIRFDGDGVTLAATIYLPEQAGDLTAVAIIQGSGASGRHNRWSAQFAEALAERGLAVLLPDKRGVGESGGDWQTAGFETLAADAAASVEVLRKHPRVHPDRVGLLGLSQGGHIAPLAASKSEHVAFVIDAVGSLVVMEDQLYHELANAYREHGIGESDIEYLQRFARASFDYLRGEAGAWKRYASLRAGISAGPFAPAVASWPATRTDPYWERWGKIYDYDPMPYWNTLVLERDLPALVMLGELDEQQNVPVKASVSRARGLFASDNFTLRIYADSGHGLFEPGTRELRTDMLDETVQWIRKATEPAQP